MGIITRFARSADLAGGMADRLDVDLTSQAYRDPLTAAQDLRRIITRCAGCTQQAACTKLQAANATLQAAPDYCRNADIMHR